VSGDREVAPTWTVHARQPPGEHNRHRNARRDACTEHRAAGDAIVINTHKEVRGAAVPSSSSAQPAMVPSA